MAKPDPKPKKKTIRKKFNALSARLTMTKLILTSNIGATVAAGVIFSPLFLVDPTGTAFAFAAAAAAAGAATTAPALLVDTIFDKDIVKWQMLSGQKVEGPAYIREQSEKLQTAIIELHKQRENATDKEMAKINKLLHEYSAYAAKMSKKVKILSAGDYGSAKELTFLEQEIPVRRPRQFKR